MTVSKRTETKAAATDLGDVEVKSANVGDLAVTVEPTADPHEFHIIGSVTGIEDEVKDIIEPGAYADTLAKRRPKIIQDHDWAKRLGRVLDIKELPPGDPGLPKTTAAGDPWPRAAGALVSRVRLFKSQEGKDAAERWREYGPEQQFSIGYRVRPGGATRDSRGVRHIKALDLFEISDVLFGAMPLAGPMPAALATKTLAAVEDGTADVDDVDLDVPETPPAADAQAVDDGVDDEDDWDIDDLADLDDDEVQEVIAAEGLTETDVDVVGDSIAALLAADEEPDEDDDEDDDEDEPEGETDEVVTRLDGDAEEKVRGQTTITWDPSLHPRDKTGRFMRVGDTVVLPGGKTGKITAIGKKKDTGQPIARTKIKGEKGPANFLASGLETLPSKKKPSLDRDGNVLSKGDLVRVPKRPGRPDDPTTAEVIATSSNQRVIINRGGDKAGRERDWHPRDLVLVSRSKIVGAPKRVDGFGNPVKTGQPDDLESKYDTSPVGTPGGKENWVDKVGGLPLFIRAIAHALIREKGMKSSRAIATAVNQVKKWAAGGGDVTAETRAKAVKTLAEWEAKKAKAGMTGKAFVPFKKAPKSKNGKPITVGAEVETADGKKGKVTAVEGNMATVNGEKYPAGTLTRTDSGLPAFLQKKEAPETVEVKDDGVVLDGMFVPWDSFKADDEGLEPVDEHPPAGTTGPIDDAQAQASEVVSKPVDTPQAASGTAERKALDLPYFAGSWEERRALLRKALDDAVTEGEFEDDATIAATFDDSFLTTVGEGDTATTYRVEYDVDADGVLSLGAVEEVAVVVGNGDSADAAALDIEAEALAQDVEMTVKAIGLSMETKAGRVISGSNTNRLKSALEALLKVLKAAGVDVTSVVTPEDAEAAAAATDKAADEPAAEPTEAEAEPALAGKAAFDPTLIAIQARARARRLDLDDA